ncbi:unnamed protein product, partial [Closterium sp. Naga37s-1]
MATSPAALLPLLVLAVICGESFGGAGALRCFTLPRAAHVAQQSVQVWWHGRKGGSGKQLAGAVCKHVRFFAQSACKGKALGEVLKPHYSLLRKFFNVPSIKKVARWTSVSCHADVTCENTKCPSNSTCTLTSGGKGVTCACDEGFSQINGACVDKACSELGCEPDGVCVNTNGVRSCKWNSPCGTCPTGATCKTIHIPPYYDVDVPHCECPTGYGMTPTECIQGAPDQVLATSITLVRDISAKDNASKPYTFRATYGCNPLPEGLAGNFRAIYQTFNIDGGPSCASFRWYESDDCTPATDTEFEAPTDANAAAFAYT